MQNLYFFKKEVNFFIWNIHYVKTFKESKISDFPEPESPVIMFKPFSKLISIISIKAIFSIFNRINMINLPYKKINFFFKKIKVLNI